MTAITITDLNNAKLDADTLVAFANSSDPTVTTRLGDEIKTIAGLTAEFEAQTATAGGTLTGLVAAATTAKDDAQAAASAIAATVIGGKRTDTWSALAAITGLATGAPGEVTNDPTGTHTDPVTAATVANEGYYTYVNPTGWKWAGTRDISAIKTAAAAIADEVATPADGNTYLVVSADGETVLGVVNGTETLFGTGVDNLRIHRYEPWRQQPMLLASATVKYVAAEGWNHIMHGGQSNPAGSADGAQPASLTQPYFNLTFNGGTRADGSTFAWTTTKPLVEEQQGTLSESPASGSAEMASNYLARRHGVPTSSAILFASVAATGGLTITQLSKGTGTYNRMLGQVTQAKALATAAGKAYDMQAVCWGQGESDAVAAPPTTRIAYAGLLNTLIADTNTDVKAIKTPQTDVHYLIAQCSYYATNADASNTALAQLDVIQSNPKAHLSHPTYFLPHDEDDTHRTVVGHKLEGAYFGRAWAQLVQEGRKPDCLWPLGGIASGTELRIRFLVPTYPLRFDIERIQKVTDYGIKVVDDTGTVTLSNHHIENGDTVVCTLGRTLGVNPRLRLALDYLPWNLTADFGGVTNGAVANIRDSSTDTFAITYQGVTTTFPLYHWCPHFESAISVLAS